MLLVQQRLLRGPNRYASVPCLMAIVDLGALARTRATGFTDGPVGALQAMSGETGAILAITALALQRACGQQVSFHHAEPVAGSPSQRRIVIEYEVEHLAQAALRLALELVADATAGCPCAVAERTAALQQKAVRYRLPAELSEQLRSARAAGLPALRVSEHADLIQLGTGRTQLRATFPAAPDTALLCNRISRDRWLTRILLAEANVPVPPGATIGSLDEALQAARRLGPDLLVKARDADLPARRCSGDAALRDLFAQHSGDGRHDYVIERFIDAEVRHVAVAGAIADPDASSALRRVCEQAAAKIGFRDASVRVLFDRDGDVFVTDVKGHAAAPGSVAAAAIPSIAVTGTNGKTTTTRMIAHAARAAGKQTGSTTTQGIYFGEQLLHAGDCTGYWSHRAVLNNPLVEIAVLEAARGGLLKRGLAFERCSVGVMLNVSDDHLGMEGIDTVEQLAAVKALVVEHAEVAVLNADDPHCVAAGQRRGPDRPLVYFSIDAGNALVQAHRASGQAAVWLHDERIIMAHGNTVSALMDVTDIPATLQGKARFNIANALAAAAALRAAGFTDAQIRAGLASFVSDAVSNPLRANIFDLGDRKIVLDYAHNPAAYAALGGMARALGSGALLAVVTSPGDRRDEDLLRIGATCAEQFDRLFVYESASRGRAHGAAAGLIASGAGAAASIDTFLSADQALHSAWRASAPGDILVFACGTSVDTLITAIDAIDPPAAQRISIQAGRTAALPLTH